MMRLTGQRPEMCYVIATLMKFGKQLNGGRIEVKS